MNVRVLKNKHTRLRYVDDKDFIPISVEKAAFGQKFLTKYFGKKFLTKYFGKKILTKYFGKKILTKYFGKKILTKYFGKKFLTQYFGKKFLTKYFGKKILKKNRNGVVKNSAQNRRFRARIARKECGHFSKVREKNEFQFVP